MEYTLLYPVTTEQGATITTVTVNRLRAKDLRLIDKAEGDMETTLTMIACATRLSPEVIDELDADDVTQLGEKVADFFGKTASEPETSNGGEA